MTPQWAWASHQPIIKTIVEHYQPNFVLESGIGLYSTPLFINVPTYLGVDTDLVWINKVKEHYPNFEIIYHNLKKDISVRHWQLTSKEKAGIIIQYLTIKEVLDSGLYSGFKVLFVDGATCTRMYAINLLWKYFDIVLYHDSQPGVSKVYGYDLLKVIGYNMYQFKTSTAWTGIFSKDKLSVPLNLLEKNIFDFYEEWNVNAKMRLE